MATTTAKPLIQIDDEIRPMNDDELKVYKAQQAENAKGEAEAAAKVAARESALAKLAKLGLTAEEVAAL